MCVSHHYQVNTQCLGHIGLLGTLELIEKATASIDLVLHLGVPKIDGVRMGKHCGLKITANNNNK